MVTIIQNGGSPIGDCPQSWDQAPGVLADLNEKSKTAFTANGLCMHDTDSDRSLAWKFDCGFKLDFDGTLCSISSRFYPPKSYYGPKWDGSIHVDTGAGETHEVKFDAPTLNALSDRVNEFTVGLLATINSAASAYIADYKQKHGVGDADADSGNS